MGNKQIIGQSKAKHPKFGQVIVCCKQNIKFNMTIILNVATEQIIEKWQKLYKQSYHLNKQFLFLPQKYDYKVSESCFSLNYEIYLTYQYLEYMLSYEIQNRRSQQYYFLQEQVWFILYNIIQTANSFLKNDIEIGDINPQNILMDKNGRFKLISMISYPTEETSIQKIKKKQKNYQNCFIAPQQIQSLKNPQFHTQVSKSKIYSFVIGMTLLEVATLQPSKQLYLNSFQSINLIQLQSRLKSLQIRYTNAFIDILKSLLKLDYTQRNQPNQIYQFLSPFSVQINNLKKFLPNKKLFKARYTINSPNGSYSQSLQF